MTRATAERRAKNLNRRMEQRGSRYRYRVQGRNGYVALDRYEGDACIDLVTVGTTSEVGTFLHAMMVALDDAAAVR